MKKRLLSALSLIMFLLNFACCTIPKSGNTNMSTSTESQVLDQSDLRSTEETPETNPVTEETETIEWTTAETEWVTEEVESEMIHNPTVPPSPSSPMTLDFYAIADVHTFMMTDSREESDYIKPSRLLDQYPSAKEIRAFGYVNFHDCFHVEDDLFSESGARITWGTRKKKPKYEYYVADTDPVTGAAGISLTISITPVGDPGTSSTLDYLYGADKHPSDLIDLDQQPFSSLFEDGTSRHAVINIQGTEVVYYLMDGIPYEVEILIGNHFFLISPFWVCDIVNESPMKFYEEFMADERKAAFSVFFGNDREAMHEAILQIQNAQQNAE